MTVKTVFKQRVSTFTNAFLIKNVIKGKKILVFFCIFAGSDTPGIYASFLFYRTVGLLYAENVSNSK